MIRALALVIALLLVALLWTLTSRVEEPEHLVTHSTSTTLGSNGPELAFNEDFGQLVDASRKPPARARTAPSKRTAQVVAGAVPDVIRRVFARFGPVVAEQAVRVAQCESGFDPNARLGPNVGVFQLNGQFHRARAARLGFAWSQMSDPAANATVAADLYGDSGWRPWSCRWAA